jgi:hypothetical protein
MEIPKEILDGIIPSVHRLFEKYERNNPNKINMNFNKERLLELAYEFYNKGKEIRWVEDINEVKKIASKSEKPWVYHYTLNLNWVVFFTMLYEHIYWDVNKEWKDEVKPIYTKALHLKWLLENVDGIIEDGNVVYLIKDDVSFINTKLEKFTLS